ncbi:hypothetical protein H6G83_28465 [Anabaena azotica FACHB-119]|uniref:Uncharacterized protein n=1 Tax=Anabaena azotica FACHB-119 TaxID=947527 RepID=A0ABR8DBD1_9NOST|nr:hypothetical protein [Anabaena azotica FACHB-119]
MESFLRRETPPGSPVARARETRLQHWIHRLQNFPQNSKFVLEGSGQRKPPLRLSAKCLIQSFGELVKENVWIRY